MTRGFKNFPVFLSVFFLLCGSSSNAFPASQSVDASSSQDDGAPVQVHGDNVEYFHEEEKVVGTGHVTIDYNDVKLAADKITVQMATKQALAEGHVVLTQKGSVFRGDRGEYNFKTKVGNVSHMDGQLEPSLYGKAKSIQKVSDGHYVATDSYITTCCGDSPFYKVQAKQVDIYPDDKVVVRNAVLLVKNVPILFIPVYVQSLMSFDRFPVQVVPGRNSQWGAFALSKWRYELADTSSLSSKGNVLFDYREKRGFGGGVDNYYRGDRIGRGAIRTYYTEDDRALGDIPSDRYRVQWREQAKLAESTTLTAEINKLSDPFVVKDFFYREEYERNAFPDNYISVITARPEYTLSILERNRLDHFFTVVERAPEVRFDTHNREFMGTPFYVREEYQFSNLRKRFADSDLEQEALRFDTNHTLSYAGKVGFLSVTPHIGTRQTLYSREADEDGGRIRGTFDPGVDISTRFYKTYDAYVHVLGLDYNQIRHIFEPSASYNFRPNPTVLRGHLQQFDFIDAIDKQDFIRFNFENKFQTKEHDKNGKLYTREIARILPFFDMNYDTHRLDNIGIQWETRPYTWLGIDGNATLNEQTRDFDAINLDVTVGQPNFNIGVGQNYAKSVTNQTTGQIDWRITPDWAVKVYDRYEFNENKSKEFEIEVSHAFNCVIVDFTYNHGLGDSFFVVFSLKGYKQASFRLTQSYRPPRVPATEAV